MLPRVSICPPRLVARPLALAVAPAAAIWSAWSLPRCCKHSPNRASAANPACTRATKASASPPRMLHPRSMTMWQTAAATAAVIQMDLLPASKGKLAGVGHLHKCNPSGSQQTAINLTSIRGGTGAAVIWRPQPQIELHMVWLTGSEVWDWLKVKSNRLNRKRTKNFNAGCKLERSLS